MTYMTRTHRSIMMEVILTFKGKPFLARDFVELVNQKTMRPMTIKGSVQKAKALGLIEKDGKRYSDGTDRWIVR